MRMMLWRRISMDRDDTEMTSCRRGIIWRKPGTSTRWKVQVGLGQEPVSKGQGRAVTSDSSFNKATAKKWVEDRIKEIDRGVRQ